jgi:hypothetical protein
MINIQVRMLSATVAMIAGALAASTDNLEVDIGIAIILVSGAMFLADYIRSQRKVQRQPRLAWTLQDKASSAAPSASPVSNYINPGSQMTPTRGGVVPIQRS